MYQKAGYLFRSAYHFVLRQGLACPSCGGTESRNKVIDRKYAVTQLRRCYRCGLMYRTPTIAADTMQKYYQRDYAQGFTTEIPNREQLARLLASGFRGTEKDFTPRIAILNALGVKPGMRILDFGCSWGFGSWQFQKAGYQVVAFEISSPRCQFARESLGLQAHSSLDDIAGTFDVVFSSHVLEHVPNPRAAILAQFERLRPGGVLIAFVPNGSLHYRAVNPLAWHRSWGLVHPHLIDEEFLAGLFNKEESLFISSSPYDLEVFRNWTTVLRRSTVGDFQGDELVCTVRKQ